MEENVLSIAIQLNNLSIMYDHKDWESLLYASENDISKPVSNISLIDKLPSDFEMRLDTELYDSSLNVKLPYVQEASCGVAHMKFSLNSSSGGLRFSLYLNYEMKYHKLLVMRIYSHAHFDLIDKTKDLNTEFVVESLYCALNGVNGNASEISHQWGSPLSIGVLLATTRSNAIGIAVDALVTEWSLEFAKFLEQAYK